MRYERKWMRWGLVGLFLATASLITGFYGMEDWPALPVIVQRILDDMGSLRLVSMLLLLPTASFLTVAFVVWWQDSDPRRFIDDKSTNEEIALSSFHRSVRSWMLVFLAIAGLSVLAAFFSWMLFNSRGCRGSGCDNPDALGIGLTALEIILAVVAIFGYWTVRRLTETTTERVAREYIKDHAGEILGPVVKRALDARISRLGDDPEFLKGVVAHVSQPSQAGVDARAADDNVNPNDFG